MYKDLRKKVLNRIAIGFERQLIQIMRRNLTKCTEPYECRIYLNAHKFEISEECKPILEEKGFVFDIPEECKPVLEEKGFVFDKNYITINPNNMESLVYKELKEELDQKRTQLITECQTVLKEIETKNDKIEVKMVENSSYYEFYYEFYIETPSLSNSMSTSTDTKIVREFFKKYNLNFLRRRDDKWYFRVN